MRRFIGVVLGLLAGVLGYPSAVLADCAGTDRFEILAREDPAGHAEILRRAAGVANGQGLFWRVERGGAAPSYLYGTFHDTEAAALGVAPAVAGALDTARLMLVEIDTEEQKRMQARMASDPTFVYGAKMPMVSFRLTREERADAEAALAARGLTLSMADRLRPSLLMSILAQPQCALEAMAAGKPVLDSMLMARAADKGVPVKGMETYEEALDSIDSIDPRVTSMLLMIAVTHLDELEDFRRTALKLYLDGEMSVLKEYEVWQAEQELGPEETNLIFGTLSGAVIDDRNRDWLEVMIPELEQGGVFAAFGAMHLIGDAGIIALLRERGYTVTRLDG